MLFVMVVTAPLRADAAVAPVLIGMGLAGSVLLTVGAVTYHTPAVGSALDTPAQRAVDSAGRFGRIAIATWHVLDQYSRDQINSKIVAAKVAFNDLKAVVSSQPTTYPALNNALTVTTVDYAGSNFSGYVSGDPTYITTSSNVDINGTRYGIHGAPYLYMSNQSAMTSEWTWGNGYPMWYGYSGAAGTNVVMFRKITSISGGTIYYQNWLAVASTALNPVESRDATPSELQQSILGASVAHDWDVFLTDHGGTAIVHYEDTDDPLITAPPFVPPVNAGVPATTTTDMGFATKVAAQSRLDAAKAAQAAAAAALAADPTNQTLIDAKTTADAEVAAASKALESADAATKEVYPGDGKSPLKSLDFSRWHDLLSLMSTVWPFTLITSIGGYLSSLIRDPVAPAFDLPIYGGNSIHISLSIFDPIAQLARWLVALLVSVAVVQRLISWWKGES